MTVANNDQGREPEGRGEVRYHELWWRSRRGEGDAGISDACDGDTCIGCAPPLPADESPDSASRRQGFLQPPPPPPLQPVMMSCHCTTSSRERGNCVRNSSRKPGSWLYCAASSCHVCLVVWRLGSIAGQWHVGIQSTIISDMIWYDQSTIISCAIFWSWFCAMIS